MPTIGHKSGVIVVTCPLKIYSSQFYELIVSNAVLNLHSESGNWEKNCKKKSEEVKSCEIAYSAKNLELKYKPSEVDTKSVDVFIQQVNIEQNSTRYKYSI